MQFEKYWKRYERLKNSCSKSKNESPSPNTKVFDTHKKGSDEVRRQLTCSFVLQKQIEENYYSATEREKTYNYF